MTTKVTRNMLNTSIDDNGNATAITINSDENVFVGSGTSNGISGGTAGLQVSGAGFKGAISASRHDNNQYGSSLMLGKSRNTSVGSNTIVQNNDGIGAITFFADDGTNLDSRVANISANVDGTPGENDTPGRLTFETTADGSAAPTERMRITSTGAVGIGTTSPSQLLHVHGGRIQITRSNDVNEFGFIEQDSSGSAMGIFTNGGAIRFGANGTSTEHMRINSSGDVSISGGKLTTSGANGADNQGLNITDTGYSKTHKIYGDNSLHIQADSGQQILFKPNATEGGRFNADGNLLLGTTSATASEVRIDVQYSANPIIQVKDTTNNIALWMQATDSVAALVAPQDYSLDFAVGSGQVTRVRIDSSGNLFYISAPGSAASNPTLKINTSTGYVYYDSSSLRYKENIQDFPSALAKVNQLRPVTYDDKTTGEASLGLIAEEVHEITPELVTYKEIDGSLQPETVVYDRLTIHLLKAIQEQQEQIELLQQEIEVLKNGN